VFLKTSCHVFHSLQLCRKTKKTIINFFLLSIIHLKNTNGSTIWLSTNYTPLWMKALIIYKAIIYQVVTKFHVDFSSISRKGISSLRATSYDPGQPGWLGFRDAPLFPSWKYRCVHMRSRAGSVTEISVFATVSVTGMKIFPYEHFSPGNRDETF